MTNFIQTAGDTTVLNNMNIQEKIRELKGKIAYHETQYEQKRYNIFFNRPDEDLALLRKYKAELKSLTK